MMRKQLLAAVAAAGVALTASARTLRTAAELNEALFGGGTNCLPFEISGVVLNRINETQPHFNFCLQDDTGSVKLYFDPNVDPEAIAPGDRLEVSGTMTPPLLPYGAGRIDNYRRTGHVSAPEPRDVTAAEFFSADCRNRLVRLTGILSNVLVDEIDPRIRFVELRVGGEAVYLAANVGSRVHRTAMSMLGARVSVVGIDHPNPGPRANNGPLLSVDDREEVFTLVEPPPDDPFAAPDISRLYHSRSAEIARCGKHSARGVVLCTWDGSHVLMRTDDGRIVLAELSVGTPPPVGAHVVACGYPEANLFHLNLSAARMKTTGGGTDAAERPASIGFADLLEDPIGRDKIHPDFHGRAVRLRATVSRLASGSGNDQGFLLEDGRRSIRVIYGDGCRGMTPPPAGSVVEATGVCVIESESWSPFRSFPRLTGAALVLRSPGDLVIVSAPPWWTPRRFLFAFGLLLLASVLLFIWNRSLAFLAARRGRQLFREEVAHCEARFRVDERTRLAVELHDSLAQNLTGVSLKIDAARKTAGAPPRMLDDLEVASKALMSCRSDLRNCLWDLRHQTLEVDSMEDALRQTLEPHTAGVKLNIRFRVPRRQISDNTAHAILRIVRELTINAVRHGRASVINVAGSIEDRKLMFSVRDNGCGFDPANCPGDDQGHYGLLGVRERVNGFEGSVHIDSGPGQGTKVTITLSNPQPA